MKKLKLTEVTDKYSYFDEECNKVCNASIYSASLRNTKIFLDKEVDVCSSWEIHFNIHLSDHCMLFLRLVPETIVDLGNTEKAPHEVMNPELLIWFTPETIQTLRERMIWDSGYSLSSFNLEDIDILDIDIEWDRNRREWSGEEMQKLLDMNEEEAGALKTQWEKRQVYKKFGL
jgi:hypothetical protein